jgi:CheY-like chemotaxis protein
MTLVRTRENTTVEPEQHLVVRTRVIVADEHPAPFAIVLESAGYEVIVAKDGLELLDCLGALLVFDGPARRPVIVVAQIGLPVVTGLEVLEGIADLNLAIPIVLLAAPEEPRTEREFRGRGAAAVFYRGLPDTELVTQIKRIRPPWTVAPSRSKPRH